MSENSNFNTIAGWTIASVLGILGLGWAAEVLYEPHYPKTPGFQVAIAEAPAAGEAKDAGPVAIDWGQQFGDPLQLAALVTQGESVRKQCVACHTFEKGGANGTGPNLWGVVGRPVASHEGFAYSTAMKEHGGAWTYDELSAFLAAPNAHIRGTKMAFAGVKRDEARIALIADLRSLADNPEPIPAPLPSVAPAEPEAPLEVTPEQVPAGPPASTPG